MFLAQVRISLRPHLQVVEIPALGLAFTEVPRAEGTDHLIARRGEPKRLHRSAAVALRVDIGV
jgi:hypothetical protein